MAQFARFLNPVTMDKDRLAASLVALAFVAPLALGRYFPGLDLPWHAAVIAVLSSDDPGREFLGYFTVHGQLSSYLVLYHGTSALARLTGDVAVAMQLVIAGYVAAFVAGTHRLSRAIGRGVLPALLAAPAAFSVTLEFGFLAYALAYPMTFWLWALTRTTLVETPSPRRTLARFVSLGLLGALIAVTHPFACAVALGGALVIAATHLAPGRGARAAWAIAAMTLGAAPAALAVAAISRDTAGQVGAHSAGLLTQQFTPPGESLLMAPRRLFGFVGPTWALVILAGGVAVAVAARYQARENRSPRTAADRCPAWLALALFAAYLITPFTFEWPRYWYAAQPRILPLVWVAALLALCPETRAPRHIFRASLAVCAAAWLVLVTTALGPFAREAADFRAVITRVAPRSRTLGLIEQPRTREHEPASPWRHATAYVLVQSGGFVSSLPMTEPQAGNAGILVPVRRAPDAPPVPEAPHLGFPRTFDWQRHAPGWDYFLIRDRDPGAPFDYFAGHAGQVRLVSRKGRWRLYVKADNAAPP